MKEMAAQAAKEKDSMVCNLDVFNILDGGLKLETTLYYTGVVI